MKTQRQLEEEDDLLNVAFDACLEKVAIVEDRLVALHYALNPVRNRLGVHEEFSRANAAIHAELNDAYRQLFMWAHIVATPRSKAIAKEKAYNYYLQEQNSIIEYLGIDPANGYSASLAARFREQINVAKKIDK